MVAGRVVLGSVRSNGALSGRHSSCLTDDWNSCDWLLCLDATGRAGFAFTRRMLCKAEGGALPSMTQLHSSFCRVIKNPTYRLKSRGGNCADSLNPFAMQEQQQGDLKMADMESQEVAQARRKRRR